MHIGLFIVYDTQDKPKMDVQVVVSAYANLYLSP